MTFKDVAVKNFKFNFRRYFAYFLCSSFSIMVLFMYSTLLFNNELTKKLIDTPIYDMMKVALIVIATFSFFFISYAHSSFMKSRNREFGLFLTLGMTKKDINKIIKVENRIIILLSLIFGLIVGTVFSKLFFMVVTRILQLKDINYIINYNSYALSIGVFLLIYIIVLLLTKIYTNKLEIIELLKNSRKSEINKLNHPIIGLLGMASLVASFILMYLTITGVIFKNQFSTITVFIIMCLVGLYLCISQFGSMIIHFSRRRKSGYYKNIISITEINHKFNQYKKVLYVVSILSGAAIFFIGLTFSSYISTNEFIENRYPYDIMYMETSTENKLAEEELNVILNNDKTSLEESKAIDFIQMELYKMNNIQEYELFSRKTTIYSENEVNKLLLEKIDVEKGHAITSKHSKEVNPWYKEKEVIKLEDAKNNKTYKFDFQQEIYGSLGNYNFNSRYDTVFGIILDDEDYNKLLKDNEICEFHLFNFKQWKSTESIFSSLTSKLKKSNGISEEDLKPVSKLLMYDRALEQYGFYLFVMCFIGSLFFISSGVVLYFKIYTDLDDTKIRYKKLFKIGITEYEMKKVISKELKPIFFLPVILGSMLGIGYIAVLFVNFALYKRLLVDSMIVALLYLLLQTIFYFISRKKYFSEVLDS
ncbi:ABC transporter permease [Clostridium sp.]|uniref:ABC transporter permease n=1 Tax=Clostridium sp. TaxID=1506 RepID=UPI003D6D3C14